MTTPSFAYALANALTQARLRFMPFLIILLVSSCAGYGWAIQRQINIACPLILQFIGDVVPLRDSYVF